MKLTHSLLIASLGAAPLCAQWVETKPDHGALMLRHLAHLCAQQVETKPDTPKPAAAATENANSGAQPDHQPPPNGRRHFHGNEARQQEQKPVTYIGLLTREVPAELRAQLSLAEGFGLLVDEVIPESPAKAAGLKVYDVLVKFEDQQLVNMEQFMSLVRSKKKGDVVQLGVISGGKETKVPVTLGEHQVESSDHQPRQGYPGWAPPNGLQFFNGNPFQGEAQRGFQNQAHALQERVERFQQEMRENQGRIQDWAKSGNTGPMPQAPQFNLPGAGRHRFEHQPDTGISIPPGTNLQRFNYSKSSSAANTTQRDDSGEYTLKNEDGKKTFIVRPNNGKEQSWPINSDAERQAVPQKFQDKLRLMDGADSGNPGPGTVIPGTLPSKDGGNKPNPPPVEGQKTSA